MARKKISGTWYRAILASGRVLNISCCSDFGTVSLAWNRPYEWLPEWTETELRDLIESTFGEKCKRLQPN